MRLRQVNQVVKVADCSNAFLYSDGYPLYVGANPSPGFLFSYIHGFFRISLSQYEKDRFLSNFLLVLVWETSRLRLSE